MFHDGIRKLYQVLPASDKHLFRWAMLSFSLIVDMHNAVFLMAKIKGGQNASYHFEERRNAFDLSRYV